MCIRDSPRVARSLLRGCLAPDRALGRSTIGRPARAQSFTTPAPDRCARLRRSSPHSAACPAASEMP
eukprot:3014535-Alexandrium_andersonii.AAC.1